ncbi:MAG: phosphoesterase, partial [Bacteroidia bacterium]|nr:phosphoesterase [Bacteroidia bacterium]
LKRQEEYIEDRIGKNSFLPENGCPIEKVDISDDIVLILIDSEWYLTNWNNHPNINDDCDITTRAKFFDEYESLIKKARGKTTIVALHHPMFTNGSHGGQYSFGSHMSPLPVLGTIKNVIRNAGGVTTVDIQNKRYNAFRERIITLSQQNNKTIFVSGHDHNLQYIVQDNLPQIVSGSGSKKSATRNVGGGQFSYGTPGYARLDIFKDGSSHVRFYKAENNEVVFQTTVLPPNEKESLVTYPTQFSAQSSTSVYSQNEVDKSKFYRSLWGDRYRNYYATKVQVPTVNLDTLYGGLKPVRKGGGHQSKSLRLEDQQGREFVMRAVRKNAIQYLQAVAFKDNYIEGQFEETYIEDLLLDIFTGAHPYAPLTIGPLADAVGVYHTNPVLYFVPKQNALRSYNSEFGNELYMIEERAADGHGDKESFGYSDELISTDDLLKELKKDEDNRLDEAAYIRARLFDMLIGDWDRHEDQWRWAKFKEDKSTIYRPVPRDRDQAFSIMSDGAILSFASKVVPALRLMQSYDEELKSPKWFNLEPYPLDIALINQSDRTIWNAEVTHIVENLTDEIIDEAFDMLPPEVNDETVDGIKRKLKGRRSNLQKISDSYYQHVNKFAVIKGTDKDDWFDIERMPNGLTKVTGYRIQQGKKGDLFHERTYSAEDTKEIWIYALDDDDTMTVFGEGTNLIKVRLIGGQNRDTYTIENGKQLKMYDHKSKKNDFTTRKGRKKLTDNYETNVYNYKKLKNSSNQIIPSLGANPDDGFRIGLSDTFTNYGFERNPFSSQHILSANYYFATQGFEFDYSGEFANVFGNLNFIIEAQFNSPNYAVNFFGFGNETPNPEADDDDGLEVDLDYNRVKIRSLKVNPSLVYRGHSGSVFKFGLTYETNEVERTADRFLESVFPADDQLFEEQDFYGINASYAYENANNEAFPTLGMHFLLEAGFKKNVDASKGFAYITPEFGINYKLISSGQIVLATKVRAHVNFSEEFEFYQAASLGANTGLRGYRNERFTGNNAFVHSTDLRINLRKVKTGLLPMNIGIYGGLDYGRVWQDDEDSDRWHNSVGGGIFANIVEMFNLNLSAFNSDDGLRLAFGMGFAF